MPIMTKKQKLNWKKRGCLFLAGTIASMWAFYVYQPWEFDFIPRVLPTKNDSIEPDAAKLFHGNPRVLIVTAHPDDAEFYLGGILTQLARTGAELHLVVCTDGDKGYYPWEDASRNRRIRRSEQIQAARQWNARDIIFLGLPDGRLRARARVVTLVREKIDALKPDYVFAFDSEYPPRLSHQDHRRAGDIVKLAIRSANFHGWLMLFSTLAPNYARDISDEWSSQLRLLELHASQFRGPRLERITRMVYQNARADGSKIGASLGEGFRCAKIP